MSRVVNAKMWQRNRALELHKEFIALASSIQAEGTALMGGLATLSKAINGRQITAGIRGNRRIMKTLRCSEDTLYRLWRQWNDGGCISDSLLLNYRYVAPKGGQLLAVPPELTAEIQRRATLKTGGRDKTGLTPISTVYDRLKDDFAARRPIPGINYDDFADGAEFPFSYKTITRHAPAKHERALGNRGVAAFRAKACHVTRDYSKLRKCELFTLDDVRLDLVCINEATGKAVEVKCYIMMEVASRSIVAFFLKPKEAITQENVDELVAHGLQVPGFGIGVDYTTHILFERGTVACSEAAKTALEGVTEGRIQIMRTSMDGGITWVGAARDRASGHAAGKAVIESFMRRLHHSLLHLPGQIGNRFDNAPASVGQLGKPGFFEKGSKRENLGTLVDEAERLAQFAILVRKKTGARLRLQLPMLYLMELQAAVKEAIDKHNHEPGHDYADHGEFAQAEVQPGVWQDAGPGSTRRPRVDEGGSPSRTYVLTAPAKAIPPKQRTAIYFRTWSAAEKAKPGINRFEITHRILGSVKKIKDMTDEEFLKIVGVFEAIAKEGAQ